MLTHSRPAPALIDREVTASRVSSARVDKAALWRAFLVAGTCLMLAAMFYRLPEAFARLLFEPVDRTIEVHGAVDIESRFREVNAWFAGQPVYGAIETADYPPASYVLLAPLLHGTPFEIARIVWAVAVALCLAWLCAILLKECQPRTSWERAFVLLLPLAPYATTATIRVGQVGLFQLPLLLAALLMILRNERSWGRDALAMILLVMSLVKPTFATPFFWLAYFRGGVRLTSLILIAYVAATLAGAAYQNDSLVDLFTGWLGQTATIVTVEGHGNIHSWLGHANLESWNLPASLLILFGAGVWTWFHRHGDPWLLLAILALVSRFWAHHHFYDDILMIPPLVYLFRVCVNADQTGRRDALALACLVFIWGLGMAPATILSTPGIGDVFKVFKTTIWLLTLALLLVRAWRRAGPVEGSRVYRLA